MKKVFMRYILPVLGVIGVVLLDQWTKYLTVTKIGDSRIVLWENVFELVYVKNNGMAWGMLQNQQWLFIVMTPIVLIFMAWFYVKMPYEKKFLPMRILEVMLAGGAIGNLLDRMFRGEFCQGHVVDMFYFKAINFPVFNVADSFISVAFVLLVVLVMFKYSEEDFDRMFHLKKKEKTTQEDSAEESENNAVEEIIKTEEVTEIAEEATAESVESETP